MSSLGDKLCAADVRPKVVRACEELVESEVAQKKGFGGAAIKAAVGVVKAIRPSIFAEVIDKLLPQFADALDPLYASSLGVAQSKGRPVSETFVEYLTTNDRAAASALLKVTDDRIGNVQNATVRKVYDKLREGAQEHVRTAVPSLARTIAPFV